MERVVVVADHQIPYQNEPAMSVVRQYIEYIRPDMVVVLGDMLDFPYLSTKFLRSHTEPGQLMYDISVAKLELEFYREHTNRLIFIEGNHEARLRNYIIECANALEGLVADGQSLSIPSLLSVPGMEYYGPYGEAFEHKSFIFKHGDASNQYAAFKELRDEGTSGCSGHTHRFQVASKTDRRGAHAWFSVPCLCNINGPNMPPGVHDGVNRYRNQQQGFLTIMFADGIFSAQPTIITNGKAITPEGRLFNADGS